MSDLVHVTITIMKHHEQKQPERTVNLAYISTSQFIIKRIQLELKAGICKQELIQNHG